MTSGHKVASAQAFGGMTQQDRDWLNVFDGGTALQQADIRAGFAALVDELTRRGYDTAQDERQDKILAAICRYVTESQQ